MAHAHRAVAGATTRAAATCLWAWLAAARRVQAARIAPMVLQEDLAALEGGILGSDPAFRPIAAVHNTSSASAGVVQPFIGPLPPPKGSTVPAQLEEHMFVAHKAPLMGGFEPQHRAEAVVARLAQVATPGDHPAHVAAPAVSTLQRSMASQPPVADDVVELCSANDAGERVGCRKCSCSWGERCYPKHVHIDGRWEDVGICDLAIFTLAVLSSFLFIVVLCLFVMLRACLQCRSHMLRKDEDEEGEEDNQNGDVLEGASRSESTTEEKVS